MDEHVTTFLESAPETRSMHAARIPPRAANCEYRNPVNVGTIKSVASVKYSSATYIGMEREDISTFLTHIVSKELANINSV